MNGPPSWPDPRILQYSSGDRVIVGPYNERGTVRAFRELNYGVQRRVVEHQVPSGVVESYLVVLMDDGEVQFPWDSIIKPEHQEPERKQVFYVAHPVSGNIDVNIANTVRWIHWLTHHDPSRVYIAPWVAEVLAFRDDPLVVQDNQATKDFYDRVLEDDKAVVRKLDGILLVGGRISEGMRRETEAAREAGLWVQDWSYARTPTNLYQAHIEALGCQ